jgi:hypothetical protein
MAIGVLPRVPAYPGPELQPRGSPRFARSAVAAVNVALVGLLGLLAARTARGAPSTDPSTPPGEGPLRFAIRDDLGRRSSIDQHAVTWAELDRPVPPPPVVVVARAVDPPGAPAPELLLASYLAGDPARSSLVLRGRDGQQRSLGIADTIDGWRALEVQIQGEGDRRVALAMLEDDAGHRITLRLPQVSP